MDADLERIKLRKLITNRFEKNLDNLIPSLEKFKNEVKKKFPQLTSTKSKKRTLRENIVKHFEKRKAKKTRDEYNNKYKKSIIKKKTKPSVAKVASDQAIKKKEADDMIASYESLNP